MAVAVECTAQGFAFVSGTDASAWPVVRSAVSFWDASGQPLFPGLGDIQVSENGASRGVTSVTCPPEFIDDTLSVVLVVDISASMKGKGLQSAKQAVTMFVGAMPQGTECAITSFDSRSYINQDFTTDKSLLVSAVNALEPGGGTNYDEAIMGHPSGALGIVERGRYARIVVMLTDGAAEIGNVQSMIGEARRMDCRFFVVGLDISIPAGLHSLASESGGDAYDLAVGVPAVQTVFLDILRRARNIPQCVVEWMSEPICTAGVIPIVVNHKDISGDSDYLMPGTGITTIRIRPEAVDFGGILPGTFAEAVVTVVAVNRAVSIVGMSFNPPTAAFSMRPLVLPVNIPVGGSASFSVRFEPTDSLRYFSVLHLETDNCPLDVSVSGGFQGYPTVAPVLRLTYPNGGEIFPINGDAEVTWSGISTNDRVDIDLSRDGGVSWQLIAVGSRGLSESWKSIEGPPSNACLMRVRKHSGKNTSDGSPDIKWARNYGGSGVDKAESMVVTADGGFVVAGWSLSQDIAGSSGKGLRDAFLVRMDASGNPEWERLYGGSANDAAYTVYSHPGGGCVFAGSTRSTDGDVLANSGLADVWVVRVDDGGDVVWSRAFGGSGVDEARAVIVTEDGGCMVVGYTESGNVPGFRGGRDAWVIKVDANGVLEWQRTFGGTRIDEAASVIVAKDGGYVFAGYTNSTDGGVARTGDQYDAWIVKLDAVGNIEWQKSYGGSDADKSVSIAYSHADGYVIAGESSSSDGDIGTANPGESAWIFAINSTGDLEWSILHGNVPGTAKSVAPVEGRGYLVAAYNWFDNSQGTDYLDRYVYRVTRLNGTGLVDWSKQFGGGRNDEACSGIGTFDRGFIIAGTSESIDGDVTSPFGLGDIWITRLTAAPTPLQSDTSDAFFSIVEPRFDISDLDIGKCHVGATKDTIVVAYLRNDNSYPINIDAISITGPDAQAFSLISTPPWNLSSQSQRDIEVAFSPNRSGVHIADINLSGTTNRRGAVTGIGVDQEIVATSLIDFGLVRVGRRKDTINVFIARNISSHSVVIDVELGGPNSIDFQILNGSSRYTVDPGGELRLNLRFVPTETGRVSGSARLTVVGSNNSIPVLLFGEGISSVPDGVITFSIDHHMARSGTRISIPVFMTVAGTSDPNLAGTAGFDLVFDGTLLFPENADGYIPRRRASIRMDNISLAVSVGEPLVTMPFWTALGSAENCIIELQNVSTTTDMQIETNNGSFALTNVCKEGGPRLIYALGDPLGLRVFKGPVEGLLSIEYDSEELGLTNLSLFDVHGRHIQSISEHIMGVGKRIHTISLDPLARGIYLLVLTTPSQRRTVLVTKD